MRFLPLLAALLAASTASAWNGPGHQTVDLIAWGQLSEDDQGRAVSLLKDHPRFDQHFLGRVPDRVWKGSAAEQDAWVFAHAGTWPDLVRSRSDVVTSDDARRFNRSRWHYVNLPIFLSPADRDALAGTLTNNREVEPPADPDDDQQNVAQAVASSLKILRDDAAPRADRAVALCWVLHLVGDSHQPCHASALFTKERFPKGDRGGNSVPVRGGLDNLHALWDASILPRRSDFSRVRREAVVLANQHAAAGHAAAEITTPKDWLLESWRLAKSTAYTPEILDAVAAAEGEPAFDKIEVSADYRRAAGLASRRRAVEAGFRIAALLEGSLPAAGGSQQGITKPAGKEVSADPFSKAKISSAELADAVDGEPRFWLNTKSSARHNRGCRWFGKTKAGHYCNADEGKACGECGG